MSEENTELTEEEIAEKDRLDRLALAAAEAVIPCVYD